jgi:hypothetical protein
MEIHKSDAAVRATAKRCAKKVAAKDRIYLMKIINSPRPLLHVQILLSTVSDDILNIGSEAPGQGLVPFKKTFG